MAFKKIMGVDIDLTQAQDQFNNVEDITSSGLFAHLSDNERDFAEVQLAIELGFNDPSTLQISANDVPFDASSSSEIDGADPDITP